MSKLLDAYQIVCPIVGFIVFFILIAKYYNFSLAVTILAMGILMFNLGVDISKPKTSSGDEQ
jgi:putative effector of murein hydrolase LrgA (UPF0299 family)